MKQTLLLIVLTVIFFTGSSQDEMPLDHYVYEDWKQLENPEFSPDGRFIFYEIVPQKGDGILVVRDLKKEVTDTIHRGYNARFDHKSGMLVGLIKVPSDSVRAAKKAKRENRQMPEDSLFIMDLKTGAIDKIANVRSYKLSEEERNLLVYHHSFVSGEVSQEDIPENEEKEEKSDKLRKQFKPADLVIFDPMNSNSQRYENVVSYSLSKSGKLVGFHQLSPDTSLFSVIYALTSDDNVLEICHEGEGIADKIVCDDSGKKLAFLFAGDTSVVAGLDLHYWEIGKNASEVVVDSSGASLTEEMFVNKYGELYFSGNSERLFFGSSPMPPKAPEDTLLDDERVSLDIWSWEDQLLQPMQKKQLEKEKKRTWLAYYDINREKPVQLAGDSLRDIVTMHKGDGNVMLGFIDSHYGKILSWEGLRYKDVYFVDPENGDKKLLEKKLSATIKLSPFGNYLLYYSMTDSTWYSVAISTGEKNDLTEKISPNFHNERNDIPMPPRSYGFAGFTEDDEYVLLYDRYDIWMVDPSGKKIPKNLTLGQGRETRTRFRYEKLDKDEYYIDLNKPLYFSAFNEESMEAGFYRYTKAKLSRLLFSGHEYTGLIKAENNEVFAFRKGNFRKYNDLYVANKGMNSVRQISNTNPQQDNFLWGDVRMVNWVSFNGDRLKGLLYTPENLDENKKYPLLVYFYERSSEKLNRHIIPAPSRSIINPSFCTSNGYVVFVPDIVYREGYPGQSAYDAVISGTQAMVERYDFIDSERMGLQGQSWGGYQIAWLITQTNLFAAAMAGAPVSNMTSAYGGIRWGSGMSRMFQYEKTQSRIGGTLWDKMNLYLENSPLFHATRIETPLLIMHNDNDGAVPWYQGIEMFVAMRRLDKPAWMLSYNGEEHNLTKWPNRIDLDIRMMQFFSHFLKGEKMPDWMEKGVPAINKNKVTGRQLLEAPSKP